MRLIPKRYLLPFAGVAVVLWFGALPGLAQTTNVYLFSGAETNITLSPGTYAITAYGAQGGAARTVYFYGGGGIFTGGGSSGAEMEAQFNFATQTTLTLLVGAAGTNGGAVYNPSGGGGGGGSFIVNGSAPLLIAGGGGGEGGDNGDNGGGNNGNTGTSGGSGDGGYPNYGGGGGSDGSGGSYPPGSYPNGQSGGGGGGGFSGDGGSGGGSLGGYGGISFLDGGAGGYGDDYVFGNNGSGAGGYGGGGGGGIPNGPTGGYGGGGGGGYSGGGGGSGQDPYYIGAGGGGGSYIDSSAITNVAEVAGVTSPDDSPNGEIIITEISSNDVIIQTEPSSQAVVGGQTVAFSISAVSTDPLSYQWLFNGTNIAGATNANYSISNVQSNDAGAYGVVVSNAVTSVDSSNAVLTVIYPPPVMVLEPTNLAVIAGSNAIFSASATSDYPMSYQWQFNGTNLTDGGQISGSTNSTLTIFSTEDASDGSYQFIVSTSYGAVTSSVASLTVFDPIQIFAQPTNQILLPGSNATFTVAATGTAPGYQWYFDGAPLTDGGNVSGSMSPALTLANVQSNNSGNYTVVVTNAFFSSTSSNVNLTVINLTPVIVSPPANLAVALGSNAVFSIYATNYFPLSFQWLFNGTNLSDGGQISGSASSNLMISSAQSANAGPYQVIVSDSYGAITSSIVSLTVDYPVQITSQPASESLLSGTNASFSVTATGSLLNYQWYHNGLPLTNGGSISGSTSPTLSISNIQTNNNGVYWVWVTNFFSGEASSNAMLTVYNPVQIVTQPANAGILPGNYANFTVSATGTALGYQWYFNGMPLADGGQISGSASPTLNITDVQNANAGFYTVAVTNLLSATNGVPAQLSLAAFRYVNVSNTTPQAPYTNWAGAATAIQDAVNASGFGDVILVTNGVYQSGGITINGFGLTNRVALDQPISLQSVNGPGVTFIQGYQVPGATNGSGAVRCVYMTNNTALIGFTISGGATLGLGSNNTHEESGGGIWCESTNTVISNCVITANSSAYSAGGVYQGALYNCIISNNNLLAATYGYGGGAYASYLVDCVIVSNTVNTLFPPFNCYGGGAYNSDLTNCVIANNSIPVTSGDEGGGISGGVLVNCTLTGNSAWAGGGSAGGTLINCIDYYNASYTPSSTTETNSYFSTFSYCCTTPSQGGTGNITSGPMLVSISQISSNSPCRGVGNAVATTGVDINGNPWANPPSIGCEEPYPGSMFGNLTVNIGASGASQAVGYPVNFQANVSGPAYASIWNFGDGTVVSNRLYISHAWSVAGSYPVILTVYNDSYPSGQAATNTINVYQPTVFYVVTTNHTPIAPYDTWAKAATNIQNALDVAIPGSVVLVSNGVYNAGSRKSIDGGTDRVAVTNALTLQSVNGAGVTFITGASGLRCIYLTNGAVLNGFTLAGGNFPNGAGVCCASTNEIVENCLIVSNYSSSSGSVYSGTVSNCTIMSNTGLGDDYSTLYGCAISSNSTWGVQNAILNNCFVSTNFSGGADNCALFNSIIYSNYQYGIYGCQATGCKITKTFYGNSDIIAAGAYQSTLTNCLLTGNSLLRDGVAAYSTLVNCTVVSNLDGVLNCTLLNCIIYYNPTGAVLNFSGGTANNCCTPVYTGGFGNITNSPLFVNQAAGNYHLQSISPCINSGNNAYITAATDFDGNPRITGGTVDIGAYEYQTPTSIISYAWLEQYGLPLDGSVDYLDMDGTGLKNWQKAIAGLNPTNPASILAMQTPVSTNSANGVLVSWQSVSGIPYLLQRSTNLMAQPPFATLQSNIVGQAGTTSYKDSSATNSGPYIYRVGVIAP